MIREYTDADLDGDPTGDSFEADLERVLDCVGDAMAVGRGQGGFTPEATDRARALVREFAAEDVDPATAVAAAWFAILYMHDRTGSEPRDGPSSARQAAEAVEREDEPSIRFNTDRFQDADSVIEFEWSDNGVRYWQELCDRVFPYEKRCAILDAIAAADGLAMTNKALAADVSDRLGREVTTQTLIGHLEVFEELGIVALLPRWDRDRDSVIKRVGYMEDWLAAQEYQKGAPVAPLSQGARLIVEYVGWEYRPASGDETVLDPDDARSLLPLKGLLFANLMTATERVPADPGPSSGRDLLESVGAMPHIELEVGSLEAISDAAYEQLSDLDLGVPVPERGDDPIGPYWHNMAVVGRVSGFEYDEDDREAIDQTIRRFSNSWISAPMELYPRQKADDVDPPGVDTESVDGPDPELYVQRIGDEEARDRQAEFPAAGSAAGGSLRGQDVSFVGGDEAVFGTVVRDRVKPRESEINYNEAPADGAGGE